MTVADIGLFAVLTFVCSLYKDDGMTKEFTKLETLRDRVGENERIAAWVARRPVTFIWRIHSCNQQLVSVPYVIFEQWYHPPDNRRGVFRQNWTKKELKQQIAFNLIKGAWSDFSEWKFFIQMIHHHPRNPGFKFQ